MQFEDDKTISSQKSYFGEYQTKKRKSLNIPIMPISKNIKYTNLTKNKNNYIFTLNSENENSTNSKYESKIRKREKDFNTISEVKKFTLIPRDSRNTKSLSQYFSQKKYVKLNNNLKTIKPLIFLNQINHLQKI